jgi:ketosteroid isomerase-like protein
MKFLSIACLLLGVVPSVAISAQAADEMAIADAYRKWSAAANAKDIERWSAYLAPKSLFLPPGRGALRTHESIRQYYLESFADRNFTLRCQQRSVEIAVSGDIAWSIGDCLGSSTGSNGEKVGSRSNWAKVWEKQPDGSWKCRLNIWNADTN